MNCFEHRAEPAVGVCRHCGRALCAACAEGPGRRLLCATPCRGESAASETASAARIDQLLGELRQSLETGRVQRQKVAAASARTYRAAAIAGAVLTAAGVAGGLLTTGSVSHLLFGVAAIFFAVFLVRGAQARNWARAFEDPGAKR